MSRSLRGRISEATANVDKLQLRTWEEFEYRIDICRVTNGAYTEYLQISIMSFHAALKLFRVCIFDRFENTLINDFGEEIIVLYYSHICLDIFCRLGYGLIEIPGPGLTLAN
jgi:hypothetical protein